MTDNKADEQILAERKNRRDSDSPLLQPTFGSSVRGEDIATPGFEIEYAPHKSQGLQSASDMWIDKSRLFDGLSKEKRDLKNINGLSRQ
ncbi:hypothetical protein [Methanolobus psychrotolerans]|uniref:hypothetical protein n=1 Tax=Methanolobus psychrotolerans TaxID=1874706 RepID=UPI000B915606|nr:hypothetical protein [Methanolobus psychrotolerans]